MLFFVLICKSIDFCCCMLLVYYLSDIVCFPIMQDSIRLKMGGQLDKRMLHWQPATCCIFQLFIVICYLGNKVLLLLLPGKSVPDCLRSGFYWSQGWWMSCLLLFFVGIRAKEPRKTSLPARRTLIVRREGWPKEISVERISIGTRAKRHGREGCPADNPLFSL